MIRVRPEHERVAHELLRIGAPRPKATPGAGGELRDRVIDAILMAMRRVPDGRAVTVTKRAVASLAQCEKLFVTERARPWPKPIPDPMAVGLIVHQSVVIAHHCPDRDPDHYVSEAVTALRRRRDFAEWLEAADSASFAAAMTAGANAVSTFLLDWPPLDPRWRPAFESTLRVQYGPIVITGRPDLVLGHPRRSEERTMAVIDWKVGQLWDDHRDEAMFYAVLATLRFRVPPAISAAVSLASGAWTHPPNVTDADLAVAAERVSDAANRLVELDVDGREPTRTPGRWCARCPLRGDCPEFKAQDGAPADDSTGGVPAARTVVS